MRWFADVWGTSDLDDRERQAFPLEWDNASIVSTTLRRWRGRDLCAYAVAELHLVAEELTELLPTMRRLQLRLPDLDALERARVVEAA